MGKLLRYAISVFLLVNSTNHSNAQSTAERPNFMDAAIYLLRGAVNVAESGGHYELAREEAEFPTDIKPKTSVTFAEQSGQCKIRISKVTMNEEVGIENHGVIGLGHTAERVEIDLSALGEKLEAAVSATQVAATTNVASNFCRRFLPKDSNTIPASIQANWGQLYGYTGRRGRVFYLQAHFVTKEQAGYTGIWPAGFTERLRALALREAKPRISQDLSFLVSQLDRLDYDEGVVCETPFEVVPQTRVRILERAAGTRAIIPVSRESLNDTQKELQWLAAARRVLSEKYACRGPQEKRPF